MISGTKDPDKCKSVDAKQIKRYTSYYIHQNRNKPLAKLIANSKAPVEHLFNDHTWCDPSWCWAKEVSVKKDQIMSTVI